MDSVVAGPVKEAGSGQAIKVRPALIAMGLDKLPEPRVFLVSGHLVPNARARVRLSRILVKTAGAQALFQKAKKSQSKSLPVFTKGRL